MEAIFNTLTDEQRVETLNNVYRKAVSTPKEQLAFASDKLVYLKPFISKLQNADGTTQDLRSRVMARQIIDELLKDILDEVCSADAPEKSAVEYGLQLLTTSYQEDFYYANKVA
ncbi:MAG: chaperonin GroEL (HSP60 family) [Bacteroidia bacterium]|jgi:chaperonin GroEL (HSP60 family)